MAETAIIIPYHQITTGLLRRAVESVLCSCEPGRFRIVVVDDASPNPPLPEIADLMGNGRCEITVLHRKNGGVGAARNTGIDHVVGSVDYICFLDSDDEFEDGHLRKMMQAFSLGADLYFCDTHRAGDIKSSFGIWDFPHGDIELISKDDELYWYRGSLWQVTLTKTPYGANSLGYRLAGQEAVRFVTEFRRACEDRFFALELSRAVKRVAFSAACDVRLGHGINIFANSTWGTIAALERILDTARFHALVGREFALSETQKQENDQCLRSCNRDFWENLAVNSVKSRRIPLSIVGRYLALQPLALGALPRSMLGLVRMKLAHLS